MTRRAVVAFVAVPILVATALLAVLAAADGLDPLAFGDRPRNVAEAAAIGNGAEVIRMIRSGEDPTRVYPLRDWVVSSSVRQATGLEAAMWARTLPMIRLLDQQGFIADPMVRHDLACLAGDLQLPDIAQYLSRGGDAACVRGDAYARVLARTRKPK